jgi:oxalate decarboxylase/phosphoglucose isomerase-like protein (cupin superfamily)
VLTSNAVPDNSGHYVENTSDTEDLVWVEVFKVSHNASSLICPRCLISPCLFHALTESRPQADRIADISLTQWLALTPAPVAAQVLNISVETVRKLNKEKQLILA